MNVLTISARLLALSLNLLITFIGAGVTQGGSQATLVLLSKNAVIPIPWQVRSSEPSPFIVLTSQGVDAKNVSVCVLSVVHEGGFSVPQGAVVFEPKTPINLRAGSAHRLSVILNPVMLQRPGRYAARVLLSAENAEPKEESLVLLRAEPALEAYPNPFQVSLTRPLPWPSPQDPKNKNREISLRELSSLAGIENITLKAGPLLFADTRVTVPGSIQLILEGATAVSSIGPGGQLRLVASVHGIAQTGEFASEIRLQSPGLKQPMTIPVKVTVTDFWLFPLLTIGIGVALSYWVSRWTTDRRRKIILERSLIQLENDIAARVQPNDACRPQLTALLNTARGQLDRGDLGGAKTNLDEAERQYHEAITPRVAPPGIGPGNAPAIVCDDPPDAWDVDRHLSFRIINPQQAWGNTTDYAWNFGDGGALHLQKGPRGQTADHRFAAPGSYQVKLSVIDAGGTISLYFSVEIKASRVKALTRQIARGDRLLSVLTVILAGASGLLALHFTGKPFGSVPDYVGALLWGFGLDKSVQGIAAIRSRVMGGGSI